MKNLLRRIMLHIALTVILVSCIGLSVVYAYTFDTSSLTTVENTSQWTIDSGYDFNSYDFLGRGEDLISQLNKNYSGYTISYYFKSGSNTTQVTYDQFNAVVNALADYVVDTTNKTIAVTYEVITIRVRPEYTSVSGPEGTAFNITFTTNLPTKFLVNIGTYQSTFGLINADSLDAAGSGGTYTKTATLTIPYVSDYTASYYINFRCDSGNAGYPWVASIPLTITHNTSSGTYHLLYKGEWDMIADQDYVGNLSNLYHKTYPRLYKRWGTGTEPTTTTFLAVDDGSIGWSAGTTIAVGVNYANGSPKDIGFFAHELTHQVEQYSDSTYPTLVYADGSRNEWWIEGLAEYGRFRYFQWANADYVQNKNYADMAKVTYNTDGSVYRFNWLGTPGTTDNGRIDQIQWFFAWMDYYWPTTKDSSGNITYGLIDTINLAVKNRTYTDSIFVNMTGYTMFDLMKKYTDDVNKNGWRFTGFGNYSDNWITENIDGLENPTYPSVAEDASLMGYYNSITESTAGNNNEGAVNLFDNNTGTSYSTSNSNPYVIFSMTQPVLVKSYDITTSDDAASYPEKNPESWVLYGSNDGTTWTSIDSIEHGSRIIGAVNNKCYRYSINNGIMYQYYKFQITSAHSGSAVQLSGLSLYGEPSLMGRYDYTIDATTGYSGEGAGNLFDRDLTTKYCTGSCPYVTFAMKQPVTVKYYSLTTANDTSAYYGRNPESWTLYGSNDASTWSVIDSVANGSNTLDAVDNTSFKFTTNNTTSYKYYKFVVNSCYSGTQFQLSELSLYGDY